MEIIFTERKAVPIDEGIIPVKLTMGTVFCLISAFFIYPCIAFESDGYGVVVLFIVLAAISGVPGLLFIRGAVNEIKKRKKRKAERERVIYRGRRVAAEVFDIVADKGVVNKNRGIYHFVLQYDGQNYNSELFVGYFYSDMGRFINMMVEKLCHKTVEMWVVENTGDYYIDIKDINALFGKGIKWDVIGGKAV